MTMRRGFQLKPGQRVLVIEDVWTTAARRSKRLTLWKKQAAAWSL